MTIAIRIQQPTLLSPEKTSTSKTIESAFKLDSTQGLRPRVRFRDSVSVRPIKHIDDMSVEQVFNVWYGNYDFQEIKQGLLQSCSRGLEYRTREGAAARRANKWNALNAVLDEQNRQRDLGIRNEQLLCQIYIAENCHSRLNALTLGIQDEKAAMAIHSDQK